MKRTKNKILTMFLVAALLMTTFVMPASANYQPTLPSLYQTFSDYFMMGVFQGLSSYFGGGDTQSMLQRHYDSWSPANEFKPSSLLNNTTAATAYNTVLNEVYTDPVKHAADLDAANKNVTLASTTSQENFLKQVRAYNLTKDPKDQVKVKGHTLFWHGSQEPDAFFREGFSTSRPYVSPEVMLARIDSYVQKVFERLAPYNDVIYSWDVFNEAMDDFTGYLRNESDYQVSNWGRIFKRPDLTGDARIQAECVCIRQAFESAAKYDKLYNCGWTLVYNDFYDADKAYEPKRSNTIKMVTPIYDEMKAAGVTFVMGMQNRNATSLSHSVFEDSFNKFANVCDQIQFTEGDTRSDLAANPNYDPTAEPYYVNNDINQGVDPRWNSPNGSYNYYTNYWNKYTTITSMAAAHVALVRTGWTAAMANTAAIQQEQADWLADDFDFLLKNSWGNGGKLVMNAVDGINDGSTYNSGKGCHFFMAADSSGNTVNTAKMSYYAIIGSKARFELKKKLNSLPDPSSEHLYTSDSWAAYQTALNNANSIVNVRIYDLNGVNNVNTALSSLNASIAGLTDTTTSLSSITVNSVPLNGFTPGTHNYNMLIPVGSLPQVDAVTAEPTSTFTITQAAALPGTATITVTSGDGTRHDTYNVNFTVDTTLSSLKVDGTQVNGFVAGNYSYTIQVPYGPVPQVTGTLNDPGASIEIIQAAALPGQAKVTVTIGSTSSAYTVNFRVDNTLNSLKVNGLPLSGFSPGTLSYNALLPAGMTTIPQVSVAPNDPGAPVSVVQAASIPGAATITVGNVGTATVYTVNFSYDSNGNDEFNSPTLNTALWHWVNEDSTTWSLTSSPGYMTISPRQGDFYGTATNAKNNLFQNSPGDWTIETKVIASIRPHATYQQAGLIAYQDMDNYIKLDWEATGTSSSIIQVCRETAGADTANSVNGSAVGGNNTLWLRMVKSGNVYTSYYSTNGTTWTIVGSNYTLNYSNVQVGLMANNGSNGTNTDLDMHFDYFHNSAVVGVLLPPDKSALITAINAAQALTESAYTPASWASEQTALSAAIAKRDDSNATQLDVNTAHNNLQSAISGLQMNADKTGLITVINAAQEFNSSNYTPASWTILQTALTAAIAKRDDPNAAQADVNTAHDNLQTAISGLVLKGPAAALTGNGSVKPGEVFTVGINLDNLTKGVYAQDITLSYDPAVFNFLNATGANSNIQILKKDSSVSGTLRIIAVDIGGVTGTSTPVLNIGFEVKDGIQDTSSTLAVIKAKLGVMPDGTEVQADLTSMTISVSPVLVDKSALQTAIAAAQADLNGASIGTEPGKYPQAAADALQAAIAAAQAVYDNSSATQAQVDDAVTALNAAKETFDASVIPAPVALVFTLNPTSAAAGDTININGKTSANTAVAVRVVKADETVVYSHEAVSDSIGNFTGTFTVPSDLTSGILYGSAEQGTYKVSSNVYIHEAGIPYTQPTEITTPVVTVDAANKTLGITNTTLTQEVPININVPSSVADSSINVAQVLNSPSGGTVTTNPLPALNISAATTISATPVVVAIPVGATVSAPETWDGTIHLPTVKDNSSVTITSDAGKTVTVDAVVEVGLGDVPLIWSKAVRILLPGQAGKLVGYSRGTTFTKITGTLSADTQAAADGEISAGGDAAIDVGADKVIWTKHFTEFVTYTETANKSALTTAINTAQDLYNAAVEGDAAGEYAAGSKAALKTEIDAANAVLADTAVDQAGVDAETAKLNAAVDTFNAAKRAYSAGDSNNNGSIDIGDLAIVAYYYNCTTDSPNWTDAKTADVNNDGRIDIEDLAYVASKIQD